MTGSCQNNTFSGGPNTADLNDPSEADTLNGDPTGCLLAGTDGSESDFLGGGDDDDDFNGDGTGNDGFDTVTYGTPYTGVGNLSITIGAGGNNDADGWGGVDDVQNDIERVIGGGGDDTINATGLRRDAGVGDRGRAAGRPALRPPRQRHPDRQPGQRPAERRGRVPTPPTARAAGRTSH